ncbi:MAG: 2-oxoacid:acceptor oxidoreductase family protein [Candidatus Dactylopiibacterium sp.]|nr:2-oxoacid:acceptor oxidoreductase family protein [Candidatus Dactylopiibacterium sp.]
MSTATHDTVWLGRGGQGAFTAARLLGLAAARFGRRHALAFPSFGPERRGAPVFAYTRLADTPLEDRSPVARADAVVVMDTSLLAQVPTPFIHAGTLVLLNAAAPRARPPLPGRVRHFDAHALALEVLGSAHANTALLGYLTGLTGVVAASALEAAIRSEFGEGLRCARNLEAFRRARALALDSLERAA